MITQNTKMIPTTTAQQHQNQQLMQHPQFTIAQPFHYSAQQPPGVVSITQMRPNQVYPNPHGPAPASIGVGLGGCPSLIPLNQPHPLNFPGFGMPAANAQHGIGSDMMGVNPYFLLPQNTGITPTTMAHASSAIQQQHQSSQNQQFQSGHGQAIQYSANTVPPPPGVATFNHMRTGAGTGNSGVSFPTYTHYISQASNFPPHQQFVMNTANAQVGSGLNGIGVYMTSNVQANAPHHQSQPPHQQMEFMGTAASNNYQQQALPALVPQAQYQTTNPTPPFIHHQQQQQMLLMQQQSLGQVAQSAPPICYPQSHQTNHTHQKEMRPASTLSIIDPNQKMEKQDSTMNVDNEMNNMIGGGQCLDESQHQQKYSPPAANMMIEEAFLINSKHYHQETVNDRPPSNSNVMNTREDAVSNKFFPSSDNKNARQNQSQHPHNQNNRQSTHQMRPSQDVRRMQNGSNNSMAAGSMQDPTCDECGGIGHIWQYCHQTKKERDELVAFAKIFEHRSSHPRMQMQRQNFRREGGSPQQERKNYHPSAGGQRYQQQHQGQGGGYRGGYHQRFNAAGGDGTTHGGGGESYGGGRRNGAQANAGRNAGPFHHREQHSQRP